MFNVFVYSLFCACLLIQEFETFWTTAPIPGMPDANTQNKTIVLTNVKITFDCVCDQ